MFTPPTVLLVGAFWCAFTMDAKKAWQVVAILIAMALYVVGELWLIKHP